MGTGKICILFVLVFVFASVVQFSVLASDVMPLNNNTNLTKTRFLITDTGDAIVTVNYEGYPNITAGAVISIKIEKRNLLLFWNEVVEETIVEETEETAEPVVEETTEEVVEEIAEEPAVEEAVEPVAEEPAVEEAVEEVIEEAAAEPVAEPEPEPLFEPIEEAKTLEGIFKDTELEKKGDKLAEQLDKLLGF